MNPNNTTPHIEFWTDDHGEPFALLAPGDLPASLFTLEAAIEAGKLDAEAPPEDVTALMDGAQVTQFHLSIDEDAELFFVCNASAPGATLYTGVLF